MALKHYLIALIWPIIVGVLAAVLILDRWVLHEPLLQHRNANPSGYRDAVAQGTPSVVNI